jgi:hypothetical protein
MSRVPRPDPAPGTVNHPDPAQGAARPAATPAIPRALRMRVASDDDAQVMENDRSPRRVQMRRTAGWRKPDGVVYVGRPTAWGNPFRVGGRAHGALDPATAVARYRDALLDGTLRTREGEALIDRLPTLRGRDLACWCDLDKPCHADVLLELANHSSFASGDPRPRA